MKTLFNYPFLIYVIAGIACLAIMIIIDFILGAEAEHLNAWVVINRLFGRDLGIPDSMAIKKFGLYGAAAVMMAVNMFLGFFLINILKGIMRVIHYIFIS